MGKYTKYLTNQSSLLLPYDYQKEWNEFSGDCRNSFNGVDIELLPSNRPNTFLICAEPELDASATTTFAIIEVTSDTQLKYRTVDGNDWIVINNVNSFVACLASLFTPGSKNSRMLELMNDLNQSDRYEGILVTDQPYEIDSNSLGIILDRTQCKSLLNYAKTPSPNQNVYIINNAQINNQFFFPKTQTAYNPSIKYNYMTFQGYLFKPDNHTFVVNQDGTINFQVIFLRKMRM